MFSSCFHSTNRPICGILVLTHSQSQPVSRLTVLRKSARSSRDPFATLIALEMGLLWWRLWWILLKNLLSSSWETWKFFGFFAVFEGLFKHFKTGWPVCRWSKVGFGRWEDAFAWFYINDHFGLKSFCTNKMEHKTLPDVQNAKTCFALFPMQNLHFGKCPPPKLYLFLNLQSLLGWRWTYPN